MLLAAWVCLDPVGELKHFPRYLAAAKKRWKGKREVRGKR